MNLSPIDLPSHEYILMRYRDKILIDDNTYRYYTVISGLIKVKKIDINNNCLDIMIIKFGHTIKLKSNNNCYYVLQALTQSQILGS